MYVKYAWLAGATSVNVLADVVKILCGETNTGNLSASCDVTNTVYLADSVAPNWTIYDQVSTTSVVLRSLNASGSNRYKLLGIV